MSQNYEFYNQNDPQRWGRDEMSAEGDIVLQWLCETQKEKGVEKVIELGCGKGALQSVHPSYIGIDIAFAPLQEHFPLRNCLMASIMEIPVKSGCIDFLFSFATIEHIPEPEETLHEIDRILARNGVAVIAPAWFCRPWAAKALPIRSYRELGMIDKILKFLIPLRNNIVWRSLWVFSRRLIREAAFVFSPNNFQFSYVKLKPNQDEYVYTDCDAFTSMDPHAAILFYKSRGYEILSAPSFIKRFFVRNEPVVIQKTN